MSDLFNKSFYIDILTKNIFPFWENNGFDPLYGGYFTCFSNDGKTLVSTDKFTWSQGRMVWVLSELAKSGLMPEKNEMLITEAKRGVDFLMNNCLDENGECVFIMRRDGTHIPGEKSIYADCFVVIGLASYASLSGADDVLAFAENLFSSIIKRYRSYNFQTAPYPIPDGLSAHGVPMIITNTARTLADALVSFESDASEYYDIAYGSACRVCDEFIGSDGILREFIGKDKTLLTSYINPGHTVEDVWFMLDEFERKNDTVRSGKVLSTMKNALLLGWDEKYGGLLLFSGENGGKPQGDDNGYADEPMTQKVRGDWDSKLWWVHSEALYSSVRCFLKSNDEFFRNYAEKLFDYIFKTFPDEENGEWIQIRARDGSPENKVVALPVKDPFHIQRNLLKLIKLLSF